MHELYISTDVETSGSVPGIYSMMSIGACLVDDDQVSFFCKLKPINDAFEPEALAKTGIDLEDYRLNGMHPLVAMLAFSEWVKTLQGQGSAPIMVGLNAAFDWSFINYYLHRFVGANPFNVAPIDIKALYMGATGLLWSDTKSSKMDKQLKPALTGTHDPLDDARYQAELFRKIRLLSAAA